MLSTFTEADPTGIPTVGVFDLNASSYKVVIAFDNEGSTPWGTGGTLTVDNIVLTNSDSTGAAWYADCTGTTSHRFSTSLAIRRSTTFLLT
ncbi:MAG: hypothetical protein R3E58_19250 [Phycisphaerae bacterium]